MKGIVTMCDGGAQTCTNARKHFAMSELNTLGGVKYPQVEPPTLSCASLQDLLKTPTLLRGAPSDCQIIPPSVHPL